jgi:hypothetical protein
MIILVLGFLAILVGALSIQFPDLVKSLKENDFKQWEVLGSPPEYAFSKSIGVFSWVLDHGYEQSSSADVKLLGAKALSKAMLAKYALLLGVALVVLGFITTLSSAMV